MELEVLMPGPQPYTYAEGGGALRPYGEDFFQRIVGVHWPKPAIAGAAAFATGDFEAFVQYARTDLAAVNKGKTAFVEIMGGFFTLPPFYPPGGTINAGSFKRVGADRNNVGGKPVFLLGGTDNGGIVSGPPKLGGIKGIIIASKDGYNWETVFTHPSENKTPRHGVYLSATSTIIGFVWDESAQAYFAAGHLWMRADTGPDEDWDVLYQSDDGWNWLEVSRVLMPSDLTPIYTGLLTSNLNNPAKLPDGFWSGSVNADETFGVTIQVAAPPLIDYRGGSIDTSPTDQNVIITKYSGFGRKSKTVNVGSFVNAVSYANGVFVAVGGANIMISGDGGNTWLNAGSSPVGILAVCGG